MGSQYGRLYFFIQGNDKEYAIKKFNLNPGKTTVITSGITWNKPPNAQEEEAKGVL